MNKTSLNLGNYYGTLKVGIDEFGNYWMELENWDGVRQIPISKELYDMLIKECKEESSF